MPHLDHYHGSDSFQYTLTDGQGGTATATVALTVNSVNDPPVAVDDFATTLEDMPVLIDVTANDTDPENNIDPSTVDLDPSTPAQDKVLNVPAEGKWDVDANGVVNFEANPNFHDSPAIITYVVYDTTGLRSNEAEIQWVYGDPQ